jgi:hypothetical protein
VEGRRWALRAHFPRLKSGATARIRRLCCLGLGGQIAVPALLGELHALIPSTNNHFLWAGPDLELANFYGEGDLMRSMPLYFSEFLNRRDREVIFSLSEVMRRHRKSEVTTFHESSLKVDQPTYERHDFYNLIMRPHGIDFALQLRVAERGRGLGVLQVPRQNGDPEFTDHDRTLLE